METKKSTSTKISISGKQHAIIYGLERARQLHHTKDLDIAASIKIALYNAGYKIIKKPVQLI